MSKEKRYNSLYMDIAGRVAKMSYACRLQVGAIIVKDGRIISMGFNGMPAGWDNNCEHKVYATDTATDPDLWDYREEDGTVYNLKTNPQVLHAESNAVSKLARSSESGEGSDLFVTHAPCMDCAKLIYQSGVKRVYYRAAYRDGGGLEFLKKSGIAVENFTGE